MAKTQDSPAPDDTVTSHLPAESPAPSVEIPAMPKATTFFGRILSSGHGHIIRLIIFLTAAGILAGKYEDLSHTGRIISGVIVFIAALEMLYSRRERKRKCLLIPASATQTSFPLGPLTAAFHESFHLPDKAHVTVREWISAAPHPILHLSGLSGVGKSSLIQAYLIPELADTAHTHRVILLRAFEDPLPELRRQLLQLWENPPLKVTKPDVPLIDLTLAALKYLADKDRRLLIIFDQFEEFFIIPHPPEIVGALRGYFQAILTASPQGLVILLSYRKDHAHALAPLALPPVTHDLGRNLAINGYSLRPFTIAEAKQFFDERHLRLSDGRLRPALEEASSYEETTAHIRPILLNLLGRIFTILATRNDAWRHTRGLIRAQIRTWSLSTELEEDIRPLLGKLISDSGTAVPCSEVLLSAALQRTPEQTRPILNDLAAHGLLRCPTPDETSPAKRLWQINHDFIARILQSLIEGLQKTLWKQVRPWIAPVSLVIWLLGVSIIWPLLHEGSRLASDAEAMRYLNNEEFDWHVTKREAQRDRIFDFGFYPPVREPKNWPILVSALSRLKCEKLVMTNSDIAELPGLESLQNLKTLDLTGCRTLSKLPPHSVLKQLRGLSLAGCDSLVGAEAFSSLSDLPELVELILSGADGLSETPPFQNMHSLKFLYLDGCTGLTTADQLESIARLKALEELHLSSCESLTALPRELDQQASLKMLRMSSCSSIEGPDSLACLRGMTALEHLDLSDCSRLKALPELRGLGQLKTLVLRGCTSLNNAISGLAGLESLEELFLGGCEQIKDLEGIQKLPKLKELNLVGCLGLTSYAALEPLGELKHLKQVHLYNCQGITLKDHLRLRQLLPPGCIISGSESDIILR